MCQRVKERLLSYFITAFETDYFIIAFQKESRYIILQGTIHIYLKYDARDIYIIQIALH